MASVTSDRAADTSVPAVLADRYRDLAALAYMIMDDGLRCESRLAEEVPRALWQVAGRRVRDAAGPGEVYAELRRRLLVLLVTGPRHQGRLARFARGLARPRLAGWLAVDAALPWRADPGLRSLVTGQPAEGRAALALAAVGHLGPDQVREVLAGAGITAPAGPDLAAGAGRVRELLAGFDASLARVRPGPLTRGRRRRRMLAAAAAVVVAGAAVIAAVTIPGGAPAGGTPFVTGPDAWTRATVGPSLSNWPASGNLTGDKPLLRAAGAAFAAIMQQPAGRFIVLYAGNLPGTGPLVVLSSPLAVTGSTDVVSYRPGRPLRILGTFNMGAGAIVPDLVPLPGGRLLVPPWHTGLRFAWLSGGGKPLSWQPLHVAGGIADVPQLMQDRGSPGTCYGNLAAVQFRDGSLGPLHRSAVTDVVGRQHGLQPAWPAEVTSGGSPNVSQADIRGLADLTCGAQGAGVSWLYAGADAAYRVDVTDLGAGTPPGAGGPVTAVRAAVQDGELRTPVLAGELDGSRVAFLSAAGGQPVALGRQDAPGGSPEVSGAWWQPEPGGSWYLLAAGVPGLRAVSSAGVPLSITARSGSFAVFSAGTATPAKTGPVLLEAAAKGGPVAATVLPAAGTAKAG